MEIFIGQFNNLPNKGTYALFSGQPICIVKPNTYVIKNIGKTITSDELIVLLEQNFVSLAPNIPELNLNPINNIDLPPNITVEAIDIEMKSLILKTNALKQENKKSEIKKKEKFFTKSLKIFILSFFIPGAWNLFSKRWSLFILYTLNLIIFGYSFLLISNNMLFVLTGLLFFNAIFNMKYYKIMLVQESLSGTLGANSEEKINELLLLLPISFIIIQLLNNIFFKGYLFNNINQYLQGVLNSILNFPIIFTEINFYEFNVNLLFLSGYLIIIVVVSLLFGLLKNIILKKARRYLL